MSEPNTDYSAAPETTYGRPSAEERQWAMFAHLSALLGGLITAGWAGSIGCFLGPLIIWQMKKETMPFVSQQAKEALNFNITLAAIMLVLLLLTFISLGLLFFITIPLMIIVGITALVFIVIAAIKANEGVAYRYPFAIRLIK